MLKFASSIKQFIHINTLMCSWYMSILIFHEQTSIHEGWSMIVSLRNSTIQISWFPIREIIEVATSRSAIQSYCIYKHDLLGNVGVLIWSPAKWNLSRIDTNTVTQIFGPSPLLGIAGSKVGTQSPDSDWELYDLGQDHGGTPRAAELLKFIFDQ